MTRNVGYIREMGLFEVIIFQRKKQQYFFIYCHALSHLFVERILYRKFY